MLLLRLTRKLVLWLLSPIILYVLSALFLSVLATHPRKTDCAVHQKIYLSTNGVHLDIILSVEKTDPHLLQKLNIPSEYRFVAFGWGDKQFYINTPNWSDLTFKTAFTALFLKSESAMHVTGYSALNSHWHEVVLCPEQMDNLNSYIQNSFSKDNDGNLYKLNISGY